MSAEVRTVTIRSASEPDVAYRVLVGIDGRAQCPCPGFTAHAHCKHADRVQEEVRMTNEQSQALVPIRVEPPRSILPSSQELSTISALAKYAVQVRGHAIPATVDTPAKAAAIMLAGHELGIRPFTALRHLFVVNGRTDMDAQIMAGIVVQAEPDAAIEIVELTAEKCTMRLRRPSRNLVAEYTYELEDARRAGLIKPNNPWGLYPKDMLRNAATKRLLRASCPDLINAVGSVSVDAVRDMLEDVPEYQETALDVASLPQGALYSPGDEPDQAPRDALNTDVDVDLDEPANEPAAADEDGVVEEVSAEIAYAQARDRFRQLLNRVLAERFGVKRGGNIADAAWSRFWSAIEAAAATNVLTMRTADSRFVAIEEPIVTLEVLLAAERELRQLLDAAGAEARQAELVETEAPAGAPA